MTIRAQLFALCCLLLSLACVAPTAKPAEHLEASIYIEADYDEVWRRLTVTGAFADWFTSPCLQFGTKPGDELVWGTDECEVYRGRLDWIEPGRGLGWRFRFIGFGFDEPLTSVEFAVLERGPTTLVSVRHDVRGAPETARMISSVGWAKPLSRLKTLLETGSAMPWPVDPEEDR